MQKFECSNRNLVYFKIETAALKINYYKFHVQKYFLDTLAWFHFFKDAI